MIKCSVHDCESTAKSLGLCSKHYQRFRRCGTTEDYPGCHDVPKVCSVDGCEGEVEAKGLCDKHYQRFKKHGSPDDNKNTHAPLEERFWRYVDKSGECWLWVGGSHSQKGYGMIQVGGVGSPKVLAHRLSYEMHHGPIPEGLVVMHKCDNPKCVNPAHLSVGTHSENTRDAIQKGRWVQKLPPVHYGEAHSQSKLTAADVEHIKTCGLPTKELAAKYGVALSTIIRARNGKNWKNPGG